MAYVVAFILGLLVSRWLETLLTRVILRLPLSEPVRANVRRLARQMDIDTQERGRVIKLADADAADALARPGQLFDNLEDHEHPDRSQVS